MTPYQLIQDAQKTCKDLEYLLQYSKNRKRDAERINTILRALKGFDDILVNKYKVNEIDKLICYIIEDFILRYSVEGENKEILDMHSIVNKIKMCILDKNHSAISRLSTQITTYEQGRLAINGDFEKLKLTNSEKTDLLVENLLVDLKTDMQWNLTK